MAGASCGPGRSNCSEPARISRPDLCLETSSLRKSLSSRCRFSMASRIVKRGRTPRNRATSPSVALRSSASVARFVSRASSTAQFTATVVVPAPPLAPRNTTVIHGGRAPAWAASRRAAVRRTAPWNDSSMARDAWLAPPGFHGKNSFAPARIACRIRSGSAAVAIANTAMLLLPARRRSMDAIPDDASERMSTTTRSGPTPSAVARPSTIPTGTPPARSNRETCRLNSSSCVTIAAANCAIVSYCTSRIDWGNALGGPGLPLRNPPIGVMCPTTSLPCILSTKKPM